MSSDEYNHGYNEGWTHGKAEALAGTENAYDHGYDVGWVEGSEWRGQAGHPPLTYDQGWADAKAEAQAIAVEDAAANAAAHADIKRRLKRAYEAGWHDAGWSGWRREPIWDWIDERQADAQAAADAADRDAERQLHWVNDSWQARNRWANRWEE